MHIALFTTAAMLLLGQHVTAPPRARAAAIVVNTLVDETSTNGLCSLREAITNANLNASFYPDCNDGSFFATDTISFSVTGTITLTSSLPSFQPSAGNAVLDGGGTITLSGASSYLPLSVDNGATVDVRRLTVTNGFGGDGGAVANRGMLTITDSSILSSSASAGGGIHNNPTGTLTVNRSTVAHNSAEAGAGIYNQGALTVANSTISNNEPFLLNQAGGGVFNAQGTLTLTHSTVSHNLNVGVANPNVTGTATLRNSVLAQNQGFSPVTGFGPNDCVGEFNAGPNNLVQASPFCTFVGFVTSPIAADPLLGPLASNGGPTLTRALAATSPALDQGSAAACSGAPVNSIDQRAVARPQGAACDLGAYELVPPPPVIGGKNLTITTGSIDLAWDGGTAQDNYVLLQYNTSTAAADLIPIAGVATSYSDATAADGTVYCYVLAALNGATFLGLSDLLCGLTGLESGAAIPQDFALKLGQTTSAAMTWAAPVGGADSYLLQRIPLNGNPISSVPLGGGVTSVNEAVVAAGTCFQLIAFKGAGFGTSNVLCGVPGVSTLSASAAQGAPFRTAREVLTDVAGRLAGLAVPAMP